MRTALALVGAMALSACSDPLAEFDQYADLQISDETRPVAALPSNVPAEGPIGPLAEIAAAEDRAELDPTVSAAVDTALASLEARAAEREAEGGSRGGLFGWLRKETQAQPQTPDAENASIASEPVAAPETEDVPVAVETAAVAEPVSEDIENVAEVVETEEPLKPTDVPEEASVEVASLSDAPLIEAANDAPEQSSKRRGLFGNRATPKGSDEAEVALGTVLPFGEVAKVCAAKSEPLGQRVERSETRGRTYSIYDTAPDSAAPRIFYVTGFADKCPRQFTAAMAMFGAPAMHEQLRYGKPSTQYPYSETDRAYEKLKKRVCGVGPQKPCGSKIEALERDTVFISTYENFSGSGRWADVLIHDSTVLATAIKKIGDPTQ